MVTNFHELYRTYAQDVYRFAYWLCGNAQDAEDITSETFVRALTTADEIKVETVKGYLLTIAKNLAFKKLKQARHIAFLDPNLRTASYGPEKEAEVNLSLHSAMRFMQTLPATDRVALKNVAANLVAPGDFAFVAVEFGKFGIALLLLEHIQFAF